MKLQKILPNDLTFSNRPVRVFSTGWETNQQQERYRMATETKRITKEDWWDICFALEKQLWDMVRWYETNEMESTKQSIKRNEELLRRLVNTKLSERDKYASFSEWVEW